MSAALVSAALLFDLTAAQSQGKLVLSSKVPLAPFIGIAITFMGLGLLFHFIDDLEPNFTSRCLGWVSQPVRRKA